MFTMESLTKKKKPKQLKDISLNEISLVDNPANKQSFLFFKNQPKNWLTDVLSAEEFDEAELATVQKACGQLSEISEEQADAIGVLILGSTMDEPVIVVNKEVGIELSDDIDDNEAEVLGKALEVISELNEDQLGAVHTLLKMGEEGVLKWPSLSGHSTVAKKDDNEPVGKNTSDKLWPSISARVPTEEKPVEKSSDYLWPTLVGQM